MVDAFAERSPAQAGGWPQAGDGLTAIVTGTGFEKGW